jgi:hypothetical protein
VLSQIQQITVTNAFWILSWEIFSRSFWQAQVKQDVAENTT